MQTSDVNSRVKSPSAACSDVLRRHAQPAQRLEAPGCPDGAAASRTIGAMSLSGG
jgi:hypothetical protein